MKSVGTFLVELPTKASTGITGFDEAAGGGWPRSRTKGLVSHWRCCLTRRRKGEKATGCTSGCWRAD